MKTVLSLLRPRVATYPVGGVTWIHIKFAPQLHSTQNIYMHNLPCHPPPVDINIPILGHIKHDPKYW